MKSLQLSFVFFLALTVTLFGCKKNNTPAADTNSLSKYALKIKQKRNWHYSFYQITAKHTSSPQITNFAFDTTFALSMPDDSTVKLWLMPNTNVYDAHYLIKDDTCVIYKANYGADEPLLMRYNFINNHIYIHGGESRASYVTDMNCISY